MSALAELVDKAAALIEVRGLCLTDFVGPDQELCPAGAVAEALDLPPGVWVDPPWQIADSDAYHDGVAALRELVASLGYQMADHGQEPWTGETLANHIAFWLDDDRPTAAHVVGWMRDVASALRPAGAVAA
ncbi:hypothetical protein ACIBEJ_34640 [Nonomuraea sp. NPDC050790]|uniref:DUF6197 family protein n=1 Tax=Nonomuraea sp. NPDC050790 TaxID=3364371 RepID=UPI0037ABA201